MTMWEHFEENFDECNGGAMYISNNGDNTFSAAGVTWLDGEDSYFACIATFAHDESPWGSDVVVWDKYDAADAFCDITDADVAKDLGTYETMEEARRAVEEAVELDMR